MDADFLRALFQPFGAVSARRMFGGHGVYADDLIFAIEVQGVVFMKSDAHSAPVFAAAGCAQWAYDRPGRAVKMPFWQLPATAYDDPDELLVWCRLALDAARRRAQAARKAPRKVNKSAK